MRIQILTVLITIFFHSLIFGQTRIMEVEGGIIAEAIVDKDGDTKIELIEGGEDTLSFQLSDEEYFRIFRSSHGQLIFSPTNKVSYEDETEHVYTWDPRNTFFGNGSGIMTRSSFYDIDFDFYTVAFDNTFFGYRSGTMNMRGGNNSYFGSKSGAALTEGSDNVFVGSQSGSERTNGYRNTFIGSYAGQYGKGGSGNIYIGYRAGASSEGSNQLIIENTADTLTPLIYGEFDNNLVQINGNLKVTERTSDPEPSAIYSNSMPMAYCYIYADGTLNTNYGVDSLIKTGTGTYDIVLQNSFSGINPVVLVTPYSSSTGHGYTATYKAINPNKIRVNTVNESGNSVDQSFSAMIMGWPE